MFALRQDGSRDVVNCADADVRHEKIKECADAGADFRHARFGCRTHEGGGGTDGNDVDRKACGTQHVGGFDDAGALLFGRGSDGFLGFAFIAVARVGENAL